jgi:hypothetical protein
MAGKTPMLVVCLALACVAAGALAGAAPADQAGVLQAGTGEISGQVLVAGTVLPVAGAQVQAYVQGLLLGAAVTDAAGAYTVTALEVDDYVVTVSKPGFVSRSVNNVPVTADTVTTLDFDLVPSGRLTGQVRQRFTHVPIPNAIVAAFLGGLLRGVATTDDRGIYVIDTDLPSGTYVVTAAKPGYTPQTKNKVTVTAGETTYVNFGLVLLGALAGQVRDADGLTPLFGATVNVFQGTTLVATTMTFAPYGVYTFGADLAPGTYTVIASKTGYVRQVKINVTVTGDSTRYVNFVLQHSGRLKGQVVDRVTLKPIIGAVVAAYEGGVLRAVAITTWPWGVYQISADLPAGTYLVAASAPGYATQGKGNITVTPDTTTYVNFRLQPQ